MPPYFSYKLYQLFSQALNLIYNYSNMKKRLVSGITATGKLTLGNYIGAIKNFVKLQDEYEMFIFVADMHALTIDIEPETLRKNKRDIMALYLAAGLDPQKTTLFFQSDIKAHGQMNWYMENMTTIGELERMTQFKDKSEKQREANGTIKIKTGLLTYPALMAGDILLYNPEIVPVGVDQKQHLELTRNIAERFNNRYGETFAVPNPYIPKVGSKIMSLQDPTKKMSKSDSNTKGFISLLDSPEEAFNKIKKAVTDSEGLIYLSDEKPGIKNLLTIYASLKDISLEEAEANFKDKNYGELKITVGEEVKAFLENLQSKYNDALLKVDEISKLGAEKAMKVANETLAKVEKKLGL